MIFATFLVASIVIIHQHWNQGEEAYCKVNTKILFIYMSASSYT